MKLAITIALTFLGFLPAAWMLFDGARRLVVGDYVRINGQLGPWTHAISALGLDPMSRAVAFVFLACGLARLIATIGYLARTSWGWHALLATSIAILWYLPIGTAAAVLTIVLLFVPLA
jgi:hypothetical protein